MRMKRILLVYVPFCTPASPPYSLTHLSSFLKANSTAPIEVLDLNVVFHTLKFPEYKEYFQDSSKWQDYEEKVQIYNQKTKQVYAENNKKIVHGGKPEFFSLLLDNIKEKKPDVVAFSIVYSSQAFYAKVLLEALKKELPDAVTVVGEPFPHLQQQFLSS